MSLDALWEQKNSPSSEVRIQVAQQLGETHLPEAYMPLVEMLHDQVPQVRRAAVRALGNLGDLRAIETLVELFEDEEFWESSNWQSDAWENGRAIHDALVAFGSNGVESLLKYIHQPAIISALGDIGDKRAFGPLVEIIEQHIDLYLRQVAILSLAKLHDARATDVFLSLIQNRELGLSAIEALGILAVPRAFSVLTNLINHPDWMYWQIDKIAQALCQIDVEQALDILIPYVHQNWIIPQRQLILRTLESIDHPRIAELFSQILHDPDDSQEWYTAVEFFWRTDRRDLLEKLKTEVPSKPAQVIQRFLENKDSQE